MKFKDFQHLLREARFQTLADTRYEGDLQPFRFTIDPNIYGSDWGTVISTAVYCPTQRPDLCISLLDITIALLTGKCEHADGSGFELVAGYIPNSGPDIQEPPKTLRFDEIKKLFLAAGYTSQPQLDENVYLRKSATHTHLAEISRWGASVAFRGVLTDNGIASVYQTGFIGPVTEADITTLLRLFTQSFD